MSLVSMSPKNYTQQGAGYTAQNYRLRDRIYGKTKSLATNSQSNATTYPNPQNIQSDQPLEQDQIIFQKRILAKESGEDSDLQQKQYISRDTRKEHQFAQSISKYHIQKKLDVINIKQKITIASKDSSVQSIVIKNKNEVTRNISNSKQICQYPSLKRKRTLNNIIVSDTPVQVFQEDQEIEQSLRQKKILRLFMNNNSKISFPLISASSFVLLDADENKVIRKRKCVQQGQVASLTKIMTCLIAIELIQQFNLDSKFIYFKVPKMAAKLRGTSANLQLSFNQVISLYDLLFGMMLPSGNDAATVISEGLGLFLHLKATNQSIVQGQVYELEKELVLFQAQQAQESENLQEVIGPPLQSKRYFTEYFINEMNKGVMKLDMNQSYFASPHGLANKKNYSCARDIAQLSHEASKQPFFMKIISTKQHNYTVTSESKEGVTFSKDLQWNNTNKLLNSGFDGIKTGNTDVAGPCLAASITIDTKKGPKKLIIVVIRSATQSQRFEDVIKLVNWARVFYQQ